MFGHLFRHLGIGILVGFAAGVLTGLAEVVVFLLIGGNSAVSRTFFLHAFVLYGLGWAAMLAGFALVAALFTAGNREKWGGPETTALHASAGFCLTLLMMVGGYMNLHCFPSATDPRSLLFDVALLAVCAGLFLLLNRAGRRILGRLSPEGGLAPLRTVTITCLLCLLVLSAAISYFPEGKEQAPPREDASSSNPYNIILIVIDTLRADHLSLYGYERETDPNLKAFARDGGVTFLEASAQASWTKPSVATILTSLQMSSHRANSLGATLPDSVTTVAEILKKRDFRTAIFSANEWISPLFNFDQGVDHIFVNTSSKIDNLIAGHMVDLVGRFSALVRKFYVQVIKFDRLLQTGSFEQSDNIAPVMTEKSLAWIEANADAPFFAYIHYIDPHAPYSPPAPYDTVYDPDYEGEPVSAVPAFTGLEPFERGTPLPPRALQNVLARHDGEILFCDHWVGQLFEGLKDLGLFEKSLIIITSDHGEEFYEHGGWDHGQSLYEELIHIPLIARLPGKRDGHRVVGDLVRHLDIAPTILDFAGEPACADMDGVSLLPVMEGRTDGHPVSASLSELDRGGGRSAAAIRTQRNKLIKTELSEARVVQHFDIEADPREQTDLFGSQPELETGLIERLDALRLLACTKAKEDAGSVEIDPSVRQRLKALGYVQ